MRHLFLCLFAVTALAPLWSEEQTIPRDRDLSTRYVAIDAYREEVTDTKTNSVTKRVIRYYMKNPVIVRLGSREMMAGEGTTVPGVLYVPLDSVVAIAGFIDNKEFTRFTNQPTNTNPTDKTPEIHSSH
ncbi:MAG: hypothetical protein AAB263_10415 [Planctomycetota bacterium]